MINRYHPYILLTLTTAMAMSCSFAPEYKRPEVKLSKEFENGSAKSTEINWEDYFTDKQLNALIKKALTTNQSIQVLGRQVEQARAMYGIKKADQLPTLGASGSLLRTKVPDNYSQSPYIPSYMTNYQATLGISSWELDFWGKLKSLKKAALEKYMATLAAKKAAELTLVAQVGQSYLYHRELQERLDLAKKSLALRKKALDLFRRKFKVGSVSKLGVTQSEILYNQARGEKAVIEREIRLNTNIMRVLLGGEFKGLDHKGLSTVEKHFAKDLPSGLASDLLTNRPDIIAAEHLLKASNAHIGAARAAFLPSISLTGAYGQVSTELNTLFDSDNGMWLFRPSINIPIFTGGKLTNQLRAAKAKEKEAVAQYQLSIQNAFREVSDALAQSTWIKEQLDILKSTLAAQKERAQLSRVRNEQGATSYLEVLDAERALFSVEQSMVEIRRANLSSNIVLFAAIGGSLNRVNIEKENTERSK